MRSLNFIISYLKYYFRGQNRHDLQSPFMYQLNERVFRKDIVELKYDKIENLRSRLMANKTLIQVRDFGAGFGGKIYKERSVHYITKHSSKPAKYARLLSRLISYSNAENLLEIGTSVGISALYQLSGNPKAKLITLEGCENTAALAKNSFAAFPEFNIEIIQGAFDDTLSLALKKFAKLDFVFIDGNHKLEPTLNYFEQCLPYLNAHSVIVIDDINWSEGMKEAWKKLKNHPRVTVSVDLFMLGILFVDTDLSKEQFSIRY